MSGIIAPLNPSSGAVADPLTIGSIYATSSIRNNGAEQIVSTSTPTTRVGGSALVAGDIWIDPATQKLRNWDGTRWISGLLWMPYISGGQFGGSGVSIAQRFTATSTDEAYCFALPKGSLVKSLIINAFINGTNNGSNYWSLGAGASIRALTSLASSQNVSAGFTTIADTGSTMLTKTIAVDTITTTGFFDFRTASWTKTGSPAELFLSFGFTYNLVG